MNSILIKQDGRVEPIEMPKKNRLELLHKCVGGYIECVNLDNDLMMVVDEEGKLKNKGLNRIATQILTYNSNIMDVIVGDVVICPRSLLD